LAERDEILHDDGLPVLVRSRSLRDFGELWSTFPRAQIFFSRTFIVGARRNLAVLGVLPIDTYFPNFVEFGPGVPPYHAETCISPSLMHSFYIDLLYNVAGGSFEQLMFILRWFPVMLASHTSCTPRPAVNWANLIINECKNVKTFKSVTNVTT